MFAGTHFTYPQWDGGLSQPPARLSWEWVLNPGPVTWQSTALPTELTYRCCHLPHNQWLEKDHEINYGHFQGPLTTKIPQPHWYPTISPSGSGLRKATTIVTFKVPVKDPSPTYHFPSLNSNIWPKSILRAHKPQMVEASSSSQLRLAIKSCKPYQAKPTISPNVAAWDIVALKCAFPSSCDTMGNLPSTYTIRTDLIIAPVKHARMKVPIEYQEQIESTLNDMVAKGVSTHTNLEFSWSPRESPVYEGACLPSDFSVFLSPCMCLEGVLLDWQEDVIAGISGLSIGMCLGIDQKWFS